MVEPSSVLDGAPPRLLPWGEDSLPPAIVDVGRRHVRQRLVVAAVIVEVDESGHRLSETAGSRVGHQSHLALDRPVVSLALTVGLGVIRRGDDVAQAEQSKVLCEGSGEIAGAVVRSSALVDLVSEVHKNVEETKGFRDVGVHGAQPST